MLPVGGDGEVVDVGTGDGPRASMEDGDGVDADTEDGPRVLTWDEDGLASVGGGGGDGVCATSGGLTRIDIEDEDGVNDVRLSRDGNSLTMYRLFFAVVPFPLESCDGGRGGSVPPDDISIYRKIIL